MVQDTAGAAALAHTTEGVLRGRIHTSPDAPDLRVFLGVPYAQPPVGPLRWRAPQPLLPRAGEREAAAFGPDCPQAARAGLRADRQDEDCLYLNIWAPAHAPGQDLPVMVWFHGGGFVAGSGADVRCDGAALARQGVVVVTFNYRVGIFGYLAHPDLSAESASAVSGNYGLQDQLAALRWIQANIGAFGGDPARVTAFGVSAGSASIALLLTSPAAEGLFAQAILHSPGSARPLATLAQAEALGASLSPDIASLRAQPTQALLALNGRLNPAVRGLTTPRVLRPIRDGWLLPEDERPVLLARRQHAMPLLLGTNRDEGTKLTATWPADTQADFDRQITQNFAGADSLARARYPVQTDADVRGQIAHLFGDTQFNYGTRLLAQASAARDMPTWRYVFTRRRPDQTDGPHHGDEVPYVFGTLADTAHALGQTFDAVDAALSDAMMHAWTQFAATGVPLLPEAAGTPWPAYDSRRDLHLELGDVLQRGHGWRAPQLDFLENFYAARGG